MCSYVWMREASAGLSNENREISESDEVKCLCKRLSVEAALSYCQPRTMWLQLCWRVSWSNAKKNKGKKRNYTAQAAKDPMQPGWRASSPLKNSFFLIHTDPPFFWEEHFEKACLSALWIWTLAWWLWRRSLALVVSTCILYFRAKPPFSQTLKESICLLIVNSVCNTSTGTRH